MYNKCIVSTGGGFRFCILCILVLLPFNSSLARKKGVVPDTLLESILKKRISEMTDGEFRYFFEYQKDIDDFNSCDDVFLNAVFAKNIRVMTENEFEYFDEFIFECDNVMPCSLKQYLSIKNMDTFRMTNNELKFFNDCTDECVDYMEKYHLTKKQRIRRSVKIAGLTIAALAGISSGCIIYFFMRL